MFGLDWETSALLELGLFGGVGGGGPVFFLESGLILGVVSSVASSTGEAWGLLSLAGGIGGCRILKT